MLQQLVLKHKSAAQQHQHQHQQAPSRKTSATLESASECRGAAAITEPGADTSAVAAAAANRGFPDISACPSRPAAAINEAEPSKSLDLCPPSLVSGSDGGNNHGADPWDAAADSPGRSSVSSAAMPAAALLMAQDIMDLDLTMDDDDDEEDLHDDHQPDGQHHTMQIPEGPQSHQEDLTAMHVDVKHAPQPGNATTADPCPAAAALAADCKLQEKCFLSEGAANSGNGYNKVQRKLVMACVLCFIFMIVEVVGGYIAKSVAIMSDAAHMLSDVSAFLVSIFAAWAATQPSSWHYSFGYHRAEILGALVSVLTIWAVTGALVFEAFQRTITPVRVDGKLMFIIASAGVVFNILIALTLGVHGHLGHSHGPDGGCSHGHSHHCSSDHSHAGAGAHDHDHNHNHNHQHDSHGPGSHGHASSCCNGHDHSHNHSKAAGKQEQSSIETNSSCVSEAPAAGGGHSHHDHDHAKGCDEPEEHKCSMSHAHAASGGEHPQPCHHSHHQGGSNSSSKREVVITIPASPSAAVAGSHCGQQGHSLSCRCTISRMSSREIEVRCELPVQLPALTTAGAAALRDSMPGTSGSQQPGHAHSHGGAHDPHSINLRSAVLHVIGDLLQSIGVAVAGALIWYNQDDPRWYLADPICTFVFSIVVLLTTRSILRDIIHVLMERTPHHMDIPAVSKVMMTMDGIKDVHDLHIWNISTSTAPVLTAHVHIGPDADANEVLQKLEAYVRGIGIDHSTIQICNIQPQANDV
eukprot:gene10311-10470_t